MQPQSAQPRTGGIINFPIRDLVTLQAAYMSFVTGGGLFISSNRPTKLGDEVFVVTSLPESTDRIPLVGKVIWISQRATGGRSAGFGIQLQGDEGKKFKNGAEKLLTGLINSEKPTFTL
jgi:type IV pilus assembly protein PilZ